MAYRGFTMKELDSILKDIDAQIATLQKKREAVLITKDLQEGKTTIAPDTTPNPDSRRRDVFPEPEEIEKVILGIKGEFKADDVAEMVKEKHTDKKMPTQNSVAVVLYQLIQSKKLRYHRERRGRRPAIYIKS